jgi:hypothetical protein
MLTVTWKYRTGETESYTSICIRDARELWDNLAHAGCNVISPRP